MLSRRALLAALAAAATPRPAGAAPAAGSNPPPRAAGLHARAQRKGLFFGAGLGVGPPHAEADLLARFPAECGLIAADAATAWAQIQPRTDQYAFEHADTLAAFAARHSLRLHGGPLLSRRTLPAWIEPTPSPTHAERLLAGHIERVVRHLRRHTAHWEVAADLLDPTAPLGLAATPFTRSLGARAIDIACHACAAADPRALRVWTEPGLLYADPEALRARASLLRLAAAARDRGAPLQAIGLQARLTGGRTPPDPASLARFCDSAGALGLKVMITGLEVDDRALPADRPTRDAGVAVQAEALMAGLIGHPAFLGVLAAGLSDRQSTLALRADGEPQRPLPLDRELRRKRLWLDLAEAFDAAPFRKPGAPPLDPAKGEPLEP
jgi:endo-1,4-beta-xylanase